MAKLVPKIRVLVGAVIAIGPGKAELLESIARAGSISAAARGMGMSYRRAWLLVEDMNKAFRRPVVVTLTGGDGGGGARLTALGEDALRRYRTMEAKAARSVVSDLRGFSRLLRAQRSRRAR